jgi:hypothetical protein
MADESCDLIAARDVPRPHLSPRTVRVLCVSMALDSYLSAYSDRRAVVFCLQLFSFLSAASYVSYSTINVDSGSLFRDQVILKSALLGVAVQALFFGLVFVCQSRDCIVSQFQSVQLKLLNARLSDKSYGTSERSCFTEKESQALAAIQILRSRLIALQCFLGISTLVASLLDIYDVFQHAQTVQLSIAFASAWALFSFSSCYVIGQSPNLDDLDSMPAMMTSAV